MFLKIMKDVLKKDAPRKRLSFAATGPLETCFYEQENSRKRKEQKKTT